MDKRYLGDGVFIRPSLHDLDVLTLTTEDGMHEPTNTIFLDNNVLDSLIQYITEWRAEDPTQSA
jgi:hypothetical protein